MNLKKKIILSIMPIMLVTIVIIGVLMRQFFVNFLIEEENKQVSIILKKCEFFVSEQEEVYQSRANDWGHWDDALEYINNKNSDFEESNFDIGSISNLDISFIIFLDNNNAIFHKIKYDHTEKNFTDFSEEFLSEFDNVINVAKSKDDFSGVFKLNNELYVVGMTNITDSTKKQSPNGKLLVGRVINNNTIEKLENISGCKIESISIDDFGDNALAEISENNASSIITRAENGKDPLKIKLIIPNESNTNAPIVFEISKTRDLFIAGMQQFNVLIMMFIAIMLALAALLYVVLGKFISRPLYNLVNDVKNINLTEDKLNRISVNGKDEFAFLQKEMNNMLEEIEVKQKKLKSSEEKLYATLFSVGDGVITVDRNLRIEFLNPVAEKLTGWSSNEAIGEPSGKIFNIINEYNHEQVASPINEVFEQGKIVELANHTLLIAKDGSARPIEDTAAPIKNKYDEIVGCVLVFRDCSDNKEKRRKIEYLSYHDQLTGLYNRRFFDEEIHKLDKQNNLPLSVIYADLNGLKTMNDAFGHIIGDLLITTFADTLESECRADDIIARVGGDEFVILLPKTGIVLAEKLAKRLKEKVRRKTVVDIPISAAFGCAAKVSADQSIRETLKDAENVMYRKKTLENTSKKNEVIKSILNTLIVKSPREAKHSQRVAMLCESIGKAFCLDDDEIVELKTAGELHDIGKIAIDEVILNKNGTLSEAEWAHIRSHPEIGYRLLSTSYDFFNLAEYVLGHHEKWDGTGYPKALKHEAINWKSRVLAVADAYDAMTSERPYSKAMTQEEAVEELRQKAGTQFDPNIVKVFIEDVLGVK